MSAMVDGRNQIGRFINLVLARQPEATADLILK
jgi:hypothetical protein